MEKTLTVWWNLMRVVLIIELIAIIWAGWLNISQFFSLLNGEAEAAAVIPLQLSIILLLIVSALWLFITLRGAFRKKEWVRSSNLTIQILVLAAATGVLQGIMGTKVVGVILLICALSGVLSSIMIAGRKKESEQ